MSTNKASRKRKKSTKGRLIKGMTKKLPAEILNNPYFTKKARELMKNYAGIYALYNGDKLYYVGLTRDLFGRIRWHQKDRHSKKWNKFIIFRIKRVGYLKDIETILHHIYDTPENRVKGRVPEDSDLNRVLRELATKTGKEHKKLVKALRES